MPTQPQGNQEEAHDVLAAEAFAVPTPDPVLDHHQHVVLPEDPTGIAEAHDILAAEEFAMPAPIGSLRGTGAALARRATPAQAGLAAGFLGALAVLVGRRRRA